MNFLKLFRSHSYPLNKIYLSRQKLLSNYHYLSSINPNIAVAPVLKSNAYGHGIEQIGHLLASTGEALGIPFFCVDSLYEAYQLQKAGVKTDILIMGFVDPRSLKGRKLPFSYAVFDREHIKQIHDAQPQGKLHLFVDTGMHREGLREFERLDRELKSYQAEGISFEGVMSHFAMPRKPDAALTKQQFNNFSAVKKIILQSGFTPRWFHIGGTYSLLKDLAKDCNVIRCGKGLYGFGAPELKPILSLSTTVVQWKEIRRGDPVGYDATFVASKNMILAVLPIGYNDGVDRRLSNKGVIRIRPLKKGLVYDINQSESLYADCPIVGRVSMNLTVIDITAAYRKLGDKTPYAGAEIEVISSHPASPNSIQNMAELCHTIPEELLVHLHPSTRREVI